MKTRDALLLKYRCQDYLDSPYAKTGHWDEGGQFWLIEPISRVEEHSNANFLQIGRPGVNGIGFGYRVGLAGLWAYYPMFGEFEFKVATVDGLIEEWKSGTISV